MNTRLLRTGKALAAALALTFTAATASQAAIIYVADNQGNTARYDSNSMMLSSLGNLGGGINQVIGIAYDPNTNGILLLDRIGNTVYTKNGTTGVSSALFNPTQTFQGGAVKNGLLYGIDEGSQTLEAYSLTTFADQNLASPVIAGHSHGLGINSATGQMYVGGSGGIFTIGDLGVTGGLVVDPNANIEDIDYFNGDFLLAGFGQTLDLVDGGTGMVSTFLTAAQLDAAGVTGSISGVAVASAITPMPEPGTLGILGLGLVGLGFARRRKAA